MSLVAINVSLSRGKRVVLRGASLTIAPGELVALVGPNGAGKSTLLRTMADDLEPSSGEVLLGGIPLRDMKPHELARQRAVLTQNPSVGFDLIVEDIVALGRIPYAGMESRARSRMIVREVLSLVGATPLADRTIHTLSGGEAQRVHLARAVAQIWRKPEGTEERYLLLDEPFSALDVAWQHELIHLVCQLRGTTVGILAIVHDLNLAAQYADRIVILRDGAIVAEGTPAAVLNAETISAAFGVCTTICPHPTRQCPVVIHHGHAATDPPLRELAKSTN
jgi:iron complex transport system ATP-binding protein